MFLCKHYTNDFFNMEKKINMIFAMHFGGIMRFIMLSGFLLFCFYALGNSPCKDSIMSLYSKAGSTLRFSPVEVLGKLRQAQGFQRVLSAHKLRTENKKLHRDLEKIKNIDEETQLKEQGFKSSYYVGVNQAREFVRVREYIRNINADPHKTHIPYFSNQVYDHIREVERGIKVQTEDIAERLKILEDFKKEAQSRIDNQTVTYDWWVIFNIRLSALATLPSALRGVFEGDSKKTHFSSEEQQIDFESIDYLKTHEGMKTALEQRFEYANSFVSSNVGSLKLMMNLFPEQILFFGVNDFGYMAFNRMGDKNHFIQLSGKTEVFADGKVENSFTYALHDAGHAERNFPDDDNTIIDQMENKIQSISDVKKRGQAELAWFILRHEEGYYQFFFTDSIEEHEIAQEDVVRRAYRNGARQMMKKKIGNFIDPKDLRSALSQNVNPNNLQQVEEFIMESADILAEIVPIIDYSDI